MKPRPVNLLFIAFAILLFAACIPIRMPTATPRPTQASLVPTQELLPSPTPQPLVATTPPPTAQPSATQTVVTTAAPVQTQAPVITQAAPATTAAPAVLPVQSQVPTVLPVTALEYTLHRGEFPWCIARRFNINPKILLRVNGLYIGQTFYAGRKLTIPLNTRPFPGNRALHPHPAIYFVQKHDNIYTIACFFGDVDPETLIAFNGLSTPVHLRVGQRLRIP